MKIIYYSPHPTHDIVSEVGYSTHQRETINAMKKLGHEVILVVLGGTEQLNVENYHQSLASPGFAKRLLRKIIPIAALNALKDILLLRHDSRAAQELKRAIELHKPDLVYERGEYLQNKGCLVAAKLGVRHFLEINSPCVEEMRHFEGPNLLHFLGFLKEKSKIKHTNHIFVVSTALKEYIQKKYRPISGITVIPNCINPNKNIPSDLEILELKKASNIEGKFVFGFVGSIFPHHGIDKLIDAFQAVIAKYSEARLLIVGGGNLLEDFKIRAQEKLPKGTYLFTGKVPHKDVLKYIGAFNVAVMPDSNWYGSPVKILEYGLLKKSIIAPNNGPLNDLMETEIDGILVSEGVESLALAMMWAIENIDEMSKMGEHFYHKILMKYTWEKQAQTILSH